MWNGDGMHETIVSYNKIISLKWANVILLIETEHF